MASLNGDSVSPPSPLSRLISGTPLCFFGRLLQGRSEFCFRGDGDVDVRIRAHSVEIGTSRLTDIKVLAIHLLKYGSRTKTAVRYVSSTAAPRLQRHKQQKLSLEVLVLLVRRHRIDRLGVVLRTRWHYDCDLSARS